MKNYRLSSFVLAAISAFLLWASPVYASVTVDDQEWYLTEEEIELLEDEYENALFNYYIEIIPYLNGQDIADAADELLWDVEGYGYDAVIVFAWEDGEIYMNIADSSELWSVLNQYYSGNGVTALLEDVFIPIAQEYSIAEGLEAIVDEVESMTEELNQGEAASEPAAANNINWGKLFQYLLIYGVLLIGIVFALLLLRKRKVGQQVTELLARQNQLLAEVLEPYNKSSNRLKMSKGATEEAFKSLTELFFTLLTGFQEREKELKAISVPLLKIGKIKQQLFMLEDETVKYEQELKKGKDQLEELLHKELNTSRTLEEIEQQLESINKGCQELQSEHSLSLNALALKLDHAKSQHEQAVKLDHSFDFLAANQRLSKLKEIVKETMDEKELLAELLQQQSGIAEQVEQKEAELIRLMDHERLHKQNREAPQQLLERAKNELNSFKDLTFEGHAVKAKTLLNQLQQLLVSADDEVAKLISLRMIRGGS